MNKLSHTRHPLFRRWTHIRQCVSNPRSPDYKPGLEADHIDDFEAWVSMLEQSIGLPKSAQERLNRIDQTRGWVDGNLRWASQSGVARNLLNFNNTHLFRGEMRTIAEISEITGVAYGTIHSRLCRGWDIDLAATVEPKIGQKVYRYED